ncbi:MAG: BCCT family transporter [Bilophila wadsworthia]
MLWNISYVPFTGGFIARISRGRTMREFVCGTVLVPPVHDFAVVLRMGEQFLL